MPRLTLVKRFTYRDLPEEWSNSYDLSGPVPADAQAWRDLAVAVHASEKTCYRSNHVLVRAYGYLDGAVQSIYQGDFTTGTPNLVPGTYAPSGLQPKWAGDQAGWLRGHIGTSSTGKKVYVRKYFHGGASEETDSDELPAALQSAYIAHGQVMKLGTLPGGATWVGPDGEAIGLTGASRYVTTRTLKRRGKRPTAP